MNFDQWIQNETGSTWEEMGGMGMPAAVRHRFYNDYEEYCFQNGIPFSLSSPKVGVTAAKLQEVAAAYVKQEAAGFEFEDEQQDAVKVVKNKNSIEIEFEMVGGYISEKTGAVMYFNKSHIPHFKKILNLLEGLK